MPNSFCAKFPALSVGYFPKNGLSAICSIMFEDGGMETATQTLHRLTSYNPTREWTDVEDDHRLVQDLQPNDMARFPWFFKRYRHELVRLPLSRSLPPTSASAVEVLAGISDVAHTTLDLPQLSRLLHLCAGVVRTATPPDRPTWFFRAAGSAGARFPLEVYVSVPAGWPVPEGVHWYDPLNHALLQVGPAPADGAPTVVVTGVPWRTGWRYRERGYRHVYWDAGTMLAQLLGAADSAGHAARLYTVFPDAEVAALVGVDRVHEFPVAVVTLADAAPALNASGPATTGEVDARPIEFPLITQAQRAGERDVLGPPWNRGAPVAVTEKRSDPIETVILARGSQRRMDPSRGLPGSVLRISLSAALRGVDLPHRVVVHDVDGLASGIYRWPDLSAPSRAGAMRDELYRVCLEQGLAHDAAFVVITAADVGLLDDRAYRDAQLTAGLVEGRLHLLAYALGASASGMTFIDSEIPELLGEPLDGLLFTCVGVPEYKSAAGGEPGAPTGVRMVTPRLGD